MNVGDLVTSHSWVRNMGEGCSAVGVVVREPVNLGKKPTDARVAIMWADSGTVDMEPVHWLEVISESR